MFYYIYMYTLVLVRRAKLQIKISCFICFQIVNHGLIKTRPFQLTLSIALILFVATICLTKFRKMHVKNPQIWQDDFILWWFLYLISESPDSFPDFNWHVQMVKFQFQNAWFLQRLTLKNYNRVYYFLKLILTETNGRQKREFVVFLQFPVHTSNLEFFARVISLLN